MSFKKSLLLGLVLVTGMSVASFAQDNTTSTTLPENGVIRIDDDHGNKVQVNLSSDDFKSRGYFPALVFIFVIILVFLKHRSRAQENNARLEAIKILADKNQPIPPELMPGRHHHLKFNHTHRHSKDSLMYRGLIKVAVGVGLAIFFYVKNPAGGIWAFGLALILAGVGSMWFARKQDN